MARRERLEVGVVDWTKKRKKMMMLLELLISGMQFVCGEEVGVPILGFLISLTRGMMKSVCWYAGMQARPISCC